MTPATLHALFDAGAWAAGGLTGLVARRRFPFLAGGALAEARNSPYYLALAVGALLGATIFGTLNLSLVKGDVHPGHSIAGALAGGILAVELYKRSFGIRASTGAVFVLPLAVGIALGRVGCFLSGLADETHGLPTSLPWGVDLGDGVLRHPVQLYESASMLAFAVFLTLALRMRGATLVPPAFSWFVAFYAVQRFVWEFLKPYPSLVGPFNLFHVLMLGLCAYAMVNARRAGSPLRA